MKKKSGVSLGPGASSLILIFVVLALSVLGMLSLMNSRNDLSLSQSSARVVEAAGELNMKTEEKRAALDEVFVQAARQAADDGAYLALIQEALPDDMNLYDREICWIELDSWEGTDGLRQLDCVLELSPLGDSPRAEWIRHSLSAVTEDAIRALNTRAENKRLALEEILETAAQSAATEAQYLAAVQNALPADMTLSDGIITFVETNAGTETEALRQLYAAVAVPPLSSETKQMQWLYRTVTNVTEDDVLLLIEQADGTLISLTQLIGDALQDAVSTEWKTVEDADALFLQYVEDRLPAFAALRGREISWTEAYGGLQMLCAVELMPLGSNPLVVWTSHGLVNAP